MYSIDALLEVPAWSWGCTRKITRRNTKKRHTYMYTREAAGDFVLLANIVYICSAFCGL